MPYEAAAPSDSTPSSSVPWKVQRADAAVRICDHSGSSRSPALSAPRRSMVRLCSSPACCAASFRARSAALAAGPREPVAARPTEVMWRLYVAACAAARCAANLDGSRSRSRVLRITPFSAATGSVGPQPATSEADDGASAIGSPRRAAACTASAVRVRAATWRSSWSNLDGSASSEPPSLPACIRWFQTASSRSTRSVVSLGDGPRPKGKPLSVAPLASLLASPLPSPWLSVERVARAALGRAPRDKLLAGRTIVELRLGLALAVFGVAKDAPPSDAVRTARRMSGCG
mmetsp:Transcript_8393/g.21977  ORF Transcript_8393/g.21977 Transcript_8393/m.21977 type:complete len:289 (-) Transcript_8393:848-1714(-)